MKFAKLIILLKNHYYIKLD